MKKYFESLTQDDIINIIGSTKKELFICMPAMHQEVVRAILDLSEARNQNILEINILLDFDAQTFRQGYGDFKAIQELIKYNIAIKSLKDNRISFIISDDRAYYLFIESRSLIPAEKITINAVKIDPVSVVRLKRYFYGEQTIKNFQDSLTNAIIEESNLLKDEDNLISNNMAEVKSLTPENINTIAEDLKRNPPLNPDYKRIVELYSSKFQYVKLKFEGSNIQHKKIVIPTSILPIADTNLRKMLDTKLNLFDPNKSDNFKALFAFKESLNTFRDNFLKKVKSREESLLDKNNKNKFMSELEKLQSNLIGIQDATIKEMQQLVIVTKNSLIKMLYDFYVANPKVLLRSEITQINSDNDYIESFAKDKSQEIVYKIKWPDIKNLVNEFKIDVQYSDITYEDLKSTFFIKELKEVGLINDDEKVQLVNFSLAIELKADVTQK